LGRSGSKSYMKVARCATRTSVARRRVWSVRFPRGRTNAPFDTMQLTLSARALVMTFGAQGVLKGGGVVVAVVVLFIYLYI
jgi:hypothetical protein